MGLAYIAGDAASDHIFGRTTLGIQQIVILSAGGTTGREPDPLAEAGTDRHGQSYASLGLIAERR